MEVQNTLFYDCYTIANNDKNNIKCEIAISGFLCIYWVYGRRLWELMIDCWKRKKALELNFAQFFWPQRQAASILLRVYYWCSYCLLIQWKKTLWGEKDLKVKLKFKIKELLLMWQRQLLAKAFCSLPNFEFFELSVRRFVTLKNGSFLLKFCNLIWNLGHSWICNLISEKMCVIYVDIHNKVILVQSV